MAVTKERRAGQDRRQLDSPLNNDRERRQLIESRKTTIIEMSISDDEWASYFGGSPCVIENHAEEKAAAIFGRAKN